MALRITLDRAEAEDVVQDTMIRVWSKRDEWSQFESVEAYCLIVAKNLAIDRSQKKEAQNVELTPEMEEERDANSPYDRMIHDEKMNIINRLVNELPEKQRLIMQLRDFDSRILAEVEVPVVKAKRLTLTSRFIPLFKAAAVIAIILGLGNVAQHSFSGDDGSVLATDTIGKQVTAPSVAISNDVKADQVLADSLAKINHKMQVINE